MAEASPRGPEEGTKPPPAMASENLLTKIFPQRRSVYPNVLEVQGRILQDHVGIEVYWLAAWDDVAGPGASLYVHDDEVMRLDCLGTTHGHMHVNFNQSSRYPDGEHARLYFPEQTYEAQIKRAVHELKANVPFTLTLNDDPRVRETRIDQRQLDEAAEWMADIMIDLLRKKLEATQPGARQGADE